MRIADVIREQEFLLDSYAIKTDTGLYTQGLGPLVEEVGEFAQALEQCNGQAQRDEIIDVLNVTLKIVGYLFRGDPDVIQGKLRHAMEKLR